jgi:hypothetical protein
LEQQEQHILAPAPRAAPAQNVLQPPKANSIKDGPSTCPKCSGAAPLAIGEKPPVAKKTAARNMLASFLFGASQRVGLQRSPAPKRSFPVFFHDREASKSQNVIIKYCKKSAKPAWNCLGKKPEKNPEKFRKKIGKKTPEKSVY